ncbi:MAG: sulfite exporter TauE/SafE family protein, partial [Fimbriimonadaceae bacterium]|nr:sulfite exporter TauE/SafE family protein [Fimbriimonadaceae bacterium]
MGRSNGVARSGQSPARRADRSHPPARGPLIEIAGYALLALAGLALGLTGGGGAILTVPILVYLFKVDPVRATGFSLGVVGLNAAVSAIGFGRRGLVEPRIGLAFAVPALVGVLLVRHFLVPLLP